MLWALIWTVHLPVCCYHVTYTFQSESTLYSCLNVKEVFARNRRDIWSLSESNGIPTHNHLRPVWQSGWVFVNKLGGCRLESFCCHLNCRYRVWFWFNPKLPGFPFLYRLKTSENRRFWDAFKGRWWWWWWWWWSWWWWWIVFVVWLTDERCFALFSAGTIVRDPHHCENPTHREQRLNLRRAWVQA